MTISAVRQERIQEEVEAQIEVKPLNLRQYFLQQGSFQDAKKVEQVDGTDAGEILTFVKVHFYGRFKTASKIANEVFVKVLK